MEAVGSSHSSPLPALRAPLLRAQDGPAARAPDPVREPRSLNLHTSLQPLCSLAALHVFLGACDASGLCVKVCARACTCAGVTTFVEELNRCAELAIMFPIKGSSAFFFAAVSGGALLTRLTGVLGLQCFLCEPHHSVWSRNFNPVLLFGLPL